MVPRFPAHLRVLNTLLAWEVKVDEAFLLGRLPKTDILTAFRPHVVFDNQAVYCIPASKVFPTGPGPGQPATVANAVGEKNQLPASRKIRR